MKNTKRSTLQIDGKTGAAGGKSVQIFFVKRKKMRGNYCNLRSDVMKLIKIDGFIEWREKAQTDIPQCGKFKLLKD